MEVAVLPIETKKSYFQIVKRMIQPRPSECSDVLITPMLQPFSAFRTRENLYEKDHESLKRMECNEYGL
jgi:hypothetical protein